MIRTVVVALVLVCGVSARTSKSDKLLKDAAAAELRADYERALELYQAAAQADPANPAAMIGERTNRARVSELHIKRGKQHRDAGELEQAISEFEDAFAADPSNSLALQEARRTTEMLARRKKRASDEATAEEVSLRSLPELKPILSRISTLRMNNQPARVLYETVGKLSGINIIFDPQFQSQGKNNNLDLNNATLDEALDYVATVTKTFWKPVSRNTIFVTEDSVAKRRDYEDQVVKVFYIRNCTTVQEFQEIATAVRSITEMRRMFTYNAQNAVVARGTPDQIALAEKIFRDLDKQKSEVVVDIMVMEVNSARTRDLAIGLVQGSTNGLQLSVSPAVRSSIAPATSTSTSTSSDSTSNSTTGSTVSLGQIGKLGWSDFAMSLPGALLKAVMTDTRTRILQSPQVRASHGQKVILKIGDRVPYATGSYQTGIATTVSPLVSTQFSYADVGVNVEITPHVHRDGEVTLHIGVEVSTVSRYVDVGGLDQPVISQRRTETDVRMRSGEVNLLGGLTQSQDSKSLSGVPGLVNIPGLGGVLGASISSDKERGNLMIAVVPRIVRVSGITAENLRAVAAGSDQTVKVSLDRGPAEPETSAAAPEPAEAGTPPEAIRSLAFAPPTQPVKAGASFEATIAPPATAWASGLSIEWNPSLLRLDKAASGAGTDTVVLDIRNDKGQATITRPQAATSSMKLQFTALAAGAATVRAVPVAKDSPAAAMTIAIE